METMYYLPDLRAGLRAIHELLDEGGRFACVVDFYGENTASHPWPKELGCEMQLLDAEEWTRAFEDAGFGDVTQRRIRRDDPDAAEWKRVEGSLFTLGSK